jgi:hypothetical protein
MNKAMDALATKEEILEAELALIQSKGLVVEYVGYQSYMDGVGVHMYNLVSPQLPGYTYDLGLPTFTLAGLRERGLI